MSDAATFILRLLEYGHANPCIVDSHGELKGLKVKEKKQVVEMTRLNRSGKKQLKHEDAKRINFESSNKVSNFCAKRISERCLIFLNYFRSIDCACAHQCEWIATAVMARLSTSKVYWRGKNEMVLGFFITNNNKRMQHIAILDYDVFNLGFPRTICSRSNQ